MKSLLVTRHAKSSWDNPLQKDFERTLNERGHRDAPAMAKGLLDKKIEIDAFISSPAKRAFTTCKYFAEAYDVKEKSIIVVPELYHASVNNFYNAIAKTDDAFSTVAIFSHNPGITEFVNGLTETKIDNMPTCGIFAVKAEVHHWNDFKKSARTFWFFDYPKH